MSSQDRFCVGLTSRATSEYHERGWGKLVCWPLGSKPEACETSDNGLLNCHLAELHECGLFAKVDVHFIHNDSDVDSKRRLISSWLV